MLLFCHGCGSVIGNSLTYFWFTFVKIFYILFLKIIVFLLLCLLVSYLFVLLSSFWLFSFFFLAAIQANESVCGVLFLIGQVRSCDSGERLTNNRPPHRCTTASRPSSSFLPGELLLLLYFTLFFIRFVQKSLLEMCLVCFCFFLEKMQPLKGIVRSV